MSKKKNIRKKSGILHKEKSAGLKKPDSGFIDICMWILLIAITFAAYSPSINGKQIWDDDAHITSPELRSVDGLVKIWIEPGATQQYYPLTHSIFWLQQRLWGDSTTFYHLFTLLMHVLSVLLLVKILRLLKIPYPWLIGSVFALHPVQVESVAWMTELKNTLSGCFYFSAMLLYLKFEKTNKRKFYFYALILFIFGLLSKSVIAMLPVTLLAIIWWKNGKLSLKRDLLYLAPFFITGIISGLFTAWVEHSYIGAKGSSYNFTIIERCLIAGRTFWFYLSNSFFPHNLSFIYPRWNVSQTIWWQYLFAAAGIALAVSAWIYRKRSRAPFALLIVFCALIFPVMGFLNVYPFRFSFVADHFQYLALIAPATAFAILAQLLIGKFPAKHQKLLNAGLYVVLISSMAIATSFQCRMYVDEETLYRATIRKNESCFMAYNNLGVICAATGRDAEARDCYQKAIKYKEDYYEAYNNLGILAVKDGTIDEAVSLYRKTISINKRYADGHYNLGCVLLQKGQTQEALEHLQTALKLKNDTGIRKQLAEALLQNNRTDEAIEQYRIVLQSDSLSEDLLYDIGQAYERKNNIDSAVMHYKKALDIKPLMVRALIRVDSLLETHGKADDAFVYFQKAIEADPFNIMFMYNYVAALKRNGKYAQAIPVINRMLELAKSAQQRDAIDELEKELEFCTLAASKTSPDKIHH